MPISGEGRKGILIVAEAPTREEDEKGRPIIGEAGQLLRRYMADEGVDLDRDCWKTNAIICRPTQDGYSRTPMNDEVEHCRPNVIKTIKDLNPRQILLLGGPAIRSVLGWLWQPDPGSVTRWAGWQIPSTKLNAWITPTYHPSFVLRSDNEDTSLEAIWFRRHLKAALSLRDRPYATIPDYRAGIELVYEPKRAAAILRKMIAKGGTVAFDYETNKLKPDAADAEIVCCSVCWEGKKTIAFPWVGEAVAATGELLRSALKKIASNLKFEERWSWKEFGHGVTNWVWDTMQAAHWLDNRREITSIKFQAFARLGVPEWDSHIKAFLSETDDEGINCVSRDVAVKDLLEYCAFDSLYEYLVAEKQIEGSSCRGLLSQDSLSCISG